VDKGDVAVTKVERIAVERLGNPSLLQGARAACHFLTDHADGDHLAG
jgi:hypothetical protein